VDKGGLTFILNLMLKMNFIGRKWGKTQGEITSGHLMTTLMPASNTASR
jgi:hypothetical protein